MERRDSPGRKLTNRPFTGDGRTGSAKPRLADTNLGQGTSGKPQGSRLRVTGFVANLFKGKHRK